MIFITKIITCDNKETMLATEKQREEFIGLFTAGTKVHYKKGEYIIRPGETPNNVFYVESGLIKAFNINKYGDENLLIVRKEHEVFPLIRLISDEHQDVIYETLTDVTVWRISRKSCLEELGNRANLLAPMLDMVTEMYRLHSMRILDLQYQSVRERIVSFLLTTADRFGQPTKDGVLINLPLRHQDIASSINSSRETTTRQLAVLERKGLIKMQNHFLIELKHLDKLKSIIE